ncbi:unnamed protein product [Gadus morhua 'NCC']
MHTNVTTLSQMAGPCHDLSQELAQHVKPVLKWLQKDSAMLRVSCAGAWPPHSSTVPRPSLVDHPHLRVISNQDHQYIYPSLPTMRRQVVSVIIITTILQPCSTAGVPSPWNHRA